jgi:RND family efflux transporter MFP subunit
MKNRIKPGRFQLFIILIFIIFSFSMSKFLESDELDNHEYLASERLLFAKTKTIIPEDYQITFVTTGTVEAKQEVSIVPQVSGRVVWVNEKLFQGVAFDQNEPLFEIDRSDFDLEVIKFEAEVARANTALDIELAETKAAISEWKQLNGDKDAPELVFRKPQLIEAHAKFKSALAQKEKARLNLSRTIYRLPFDGQVVESNLAEGQFVSAGQAYGKVYDNRFVELHSFMSDKQLKWLHDSTDAEVEIKIIAYGVENEYKGKLKRNATSIDKSTRLAHVRFSLNDSPDKILVGSFAKITAKGKLERNAAIIPSSSLQKDGKILIVNEDNIISKIQPHIIQSTDDSIVIKGIAKSFKIIVNNMPGAIDGMKITTDSKVN